MYPADQLVRRLRERGERITIQRKLVITALCEGGSHRTINDIRRHLEQQGQAMDESTIYRILQWLKALSVISQTDLGANGTVYELIEATPHHHLVCLCCGGVMELDDRFADHLREVLRHEYNFEPRLDHMAIFGCCHDCLAKTETHAKASH